MGRPSFSPMALASSITALTKPRTRSSSRMRSVVAPVRALMGFMVRLPCSLNQMSFWMQSLAEPAPDGVRPVNACFHG